MKNEENEKKPLEEKTPKKKPAEKKAAAEKKPAEKKAAAEKKPAEKKVAEKKPAEKKAAEKKPAEKKAAAEKKPAEKKAAAEKKKAAEPEAKAPDEELLPTPPELDPKKLGEELEGLKDLVQGEIDKMMSENPEAEWKDVVKAAQEEKIAARAHSKDEKLCECCGKNPVDDDEDYCEECLETMKHYPFEWWKMLVPVIFIVGVVFACSLIAISWSVFSKTAAAQGLAKDNKPDSALASYENINAEIKVTDNNYGYKYLRNQVEIYQSIGIDEYENLSKFIDTYYAGTAIDKKQNKAAKAAKKEVSDYSDAYSYFSKAATNATDYKSFVTAYEEQVKDRGVNPAFVGYYKYYASLVYKESSAVKKANVAAIEKAAPEMASLYLPLYAEIAVNDKDYDAVLKYANKLYETNNESTYAFLYKTVAYRMKGNTPLAVKACADALKSAPNNPLINYQMCVLSLLQGQNKAALNYASIAYENANTENSFMSSSSIYALCAYLNSDEDAYNKVTEGLSQYGYSLSPDVQNVIDGKKTIKQIFTEGEGDFAWA